MIRVKDEARFLPEWLAHHLNVGVEHVYVYDNNSSDDIERVIMPFVERGLVTYVPWPTVPASPSATTTSSPSSARRASGWPSSTPTSSWSRTPGAPLETLGAAGRAPAIAVNWRYYGSSGHEGPTRTRDRDVHPGGCDAQPTRQGHRPPGHGAALPHLPPTRTTGGDGSHGHRPADASTARS